ncbi:S49 family peptidase [Candidatus Similichlamydia epinepheli]|uniref:S49 family peptidase n=1 Tax=Candidatus Similichlamydia epinepheli TaxID=1903953 RepID=UPI0013001E3C|nr:S49 family peptidase [Candidatus Similichlamydia epinepheli]
MKSYRDSFFHAFLKSTGWLFGLLVSCLFVAGLATFLLSRAPLSSGGKYALYTSSNANGVFLEPDLDRSVFLEISFRGEMNGRSFSRNDVEGALDYATNLISEKWRGIVALIINVDSPGGLAKEGFDLFDCLEVWKQKEQIPIYVLVNGMCASAAFFTSCVADRIFADSISLIGSIGVVSPCVSFGETLEKIGVDVKLVSAGTGKTDLHYLLPLDEEGISRRQTLVDQIYDRFLKHVSLHRKIPIERLREEIGASIFLPEEAFELGLIDEVVTGRAGCLRSIERLQGTVESSVVRVEKVSTFPSMFEAWFSSLDTSSFLSYFSIR